MRDNRTRVNRSLGQWSSTFLMLRSIIEVLSHKIFIAALILTLL